MAADMRPTPGIPPSELRLPAEPRAVTRVGRRLPSLEDRTRTGYALVMVYMLFEFTRLADVISPLALVRPQMLLIIALAIAWLATKEKPELRDLRIQVALAFVALCWFSMVYATNTFFAYSTARQLSMTIICGLLAVAAFVNNAERLNALFRLLGGCIAFLAIWVITHGGKGPGGFVSDENDAAFALNMGLPIAYFLARDVRRGGRERLLWWLAAGLMAAGVVASASRGGFLGLLAALGVCWWYSPDRARVAALSGVLGLVAGGAILSYTPGGANTSPTGGGQSYFEIVSSISDANDKTRVARIFYWKLGFQTFLHYPILGAGAGNYPWVAAKYESEVAVTDAEKRARSSGGRVAHSLYFTLLPEQGIVGTTLWVTMLLTCAVRLRKVIARPDSTRDSYGAYARGLLGGFAGALVAAVFLSVLYYPNIWYLVGLSIPVSALALGGFAVAPPAVRSRGNRTKRAPG